MPRSTKSMAKIIEAIYEIGVLKSLEKECPYEKR
uniref:Antitoxin n=1 Tax=Archaeoglobus fulgidus TaxID=2234 RepID=A0A7J3M2G1_ARCFL